MIAQVSRVHPPQQSKSGGTYQKIEFITQPEKQWTYTYVCEDHFNFERWKPFLEHQGVWVSDLEWTEKNGKMIIDADSPVKYYKEHRNIEVSQLSLKF